MKLLIRNLKRSTTESEIQAIFEAYGTVDSCALVMDDATGKSKGFGFVEMPDSEEAQAAMKAIDGTKISGSRVRVRESA